MPRLLFASLASCLLVAPGCEKKPEGPDPANMKICEEAGKRYVQCLEETLGKEAADMAKAKSNVEGCAADQRTVDWYRDKCLPTKDCDAFMECTMDLAMQEP